MRNSLDVAWGMEVSGEFTLQMIHRETGVSLSTIQKMRRAVFVLGRYARTFPRWKDARREAAKEPGFEYTSWPEHEQRYEDVQKRYASELQAVMGVKIDNPH